jgi:hypothetical protein
MPRAALVYCSLSAVLAGARPGSADDWAARAIVRRALKACGVSEPERPLALRCRFRLKPAAAVPDLEGFAITLGDSRGRSARLELYRPEGKGCLGKVVTHRGESWKWQQGSREELTGESLRNWAQLRHGQSIVWLLPLLQNKQFTLSVLSESLFEGRTLTGIRVAYPGQKDILLYFAKDTGLLTKAEFSWAKDTPITEIFRDNHAVTWCKREVAILKAGGVAANNQALLGLLRQTIPRSARAAELARLAEQLGSPSFKVRRRASRSLQVVGVSAVAWLRQASRSPDLEVAVHAGKLLKDLDRFPPNRLRLAALRVLAWRCPPGTAAALLDLLPHVSPGEERRTAEAALEAVALRGKKPDPCLVRALCGSEPRRSLAAKALRRAAEPAGRPVYLRGLRVSHRMEFLVKGEKAFEMELLELECFNALKENWLTGP